MNPKGCEKSIYLGPWPEKNGLSTFAGVSLAGLVALWSAGLRLIEWPSWNQPAFLLEGLPVLPTADAYAWLAGSQGVGRLSGWPMSRLVHFLELISGVAPEWIAFWLPLGLACLPGLVVALLCWRKGGWLAGLVAGVFATSALGFLARTRLGYADTDLFAVFLASGHAALWSWGIERVKQGVPVAGAHWWRLVSPAVSIVAFAGLAQWLYPSGYPIMLAVSATAVLVGVGLAGLSTLGFFLVLSCCVMVASHFGVAGVMLGVVGAGIISLHRSVPVFAGLLVLGAVVMAVGIADAVFLEQTMRRVDAYIGWQSAPPTSHEWILPSIDASIQENVGVGWSEYFQRTGTNWMFLAAGIAGYALTVWRWPSLLGFLPLLVLGLASFHLGHRFSVYSTPVLGLGLGLGLAVCLQYLGSPTRVRALAHLVLAASVAGVVLWEARNLEADPAVDPLWAQALKAMRDLDDDRGRVWAWWDEGYPAQFYSQLPTMADGGNASRLRTFALGNVFGARDPGQAAAFLRLAATERAEALQAEPGPWRQVSYGIEPLESMTHLEAREAQRLLEQQGLIEARSGAIDLPDEYVVASWPTLRKAQWADLYGRWRLTSGENGHGRIMTLEPPVRLDEPSGMLKTAQGPVALRSIHIFDSGNRYRNEWNRPGGAHAVINNDVGEGVIMGMDLFQTMAVQLLIADPHALDRHFELVVDAAPAARIFRVRSSGSLEHPSG
jgi:dolichyl-diphosphooligosaccharide--protein glycosyltransferase